MEIMKINKIKKAQKLIQLTKEIMDINKILKSHGNL